MAKKLVWKWEELDCHTKRAKVVGGWLIHALVDDGKKMTSAMVFIQDRDHEWLILPPPIPVEAK